MPFDGHLFFKLVRLRRDHALVMRSGSFFQTSEKPCRFFVPFLSRCGRLGHSVTPVLRVRLAQQLRPLLPPADVSQMLVPALTPPQPPLPGADRPNAAGRSEAAPMRTGRSRRKCPLPQCNQPPRQSGAVHRRMRRGLPMSPVMQRFHGVFATSS